MSARDKPKYTLWWISGDKQASLWSGDYESRIEAELAIEECEAEYRDQCKSNGYSSYDEDATWLIEEPKSRSAYMPPYHPSWGRYVPDVQPTLYKWHDPHLRFR